MRIVQALALLSILLAFVLVVVLLAEYGDAKCKVADFLNFSSCLLRTRPELSGSLIGAAGTIFAGWIAWVGVQSQILRQERANILAEAGILRARKAEIENEIYALNIGRHLLVPFEVASKQSDSFQGLGEIFLRASEHRVKIGIESEEFEAMCEHAPLRFSVGARRAMYRLNLAKQDAILFARVKANEVPMPLEGESYFDSSRKIGSVGLKELLEQARQAKEEISRCENDLKKVDALLKKIAP